MNLKAFIHPLYFAINPQGSVITPRAHGIDASKYDLFFEPALATSQLDFVIQRISYRTTRDEYFEKLLPGVMSVPIRGGYHYLNSDKSWREQADAYLSFVHGYDYHVHVCDLEDAFNVMGPEFVYQAWQWIQYVKSKTGKPVLLYTSPSLYEKYVIPSQAKYGINWNTVDLWTAQWFYIPNPDGTPYMPKGRTAGWKLWQYTDKGDGTKFGVARSTACDLNVFNGSVSDMRRWLKLDDSPPPISTNLEYQKVSRFGSDCHIVIADLNKYRALVTNTEGYLRTVSDVAKEHGEPFAVVNGDGWRNLPFPHYPMSIAASDGDLYQDVQYDYRPFLNITRDGRIQITWNDRSQLHNTVSGTRFVIQDGAKNPAFDGTDIVYIEKHPRTCAGRKTDGRLILVVVDGRSESNSGVTLSELADIMLECGAMDALELDGGGSSAMWYGGKIVNVPSDGQERAVVNHLVLIAKEIINMTVKTTPVTGYIVPITTTKVRKDFSTYSLEIPPSTPAGAKVNIDQIIERLDTTQTHDRAGDLWGRLVSGGYMAIDYHNTTTFAPQKICDKFYTVNGTDPDTDPDPGGEPTTPTFPNMAFNFDLAADGSLLVKVRADRPVIVTVDENNSGQYVEYKKPL